MPRNIKQASFTIQLLERGEWHTDRRAASRDEAESAANRLFDSKSNCRGVRVLQEQFDAATAGYHDITVFHRVSSDQDALSRERAQRHAEDLMARHRDRKQRRAEALLAAEKRRIQRTAAWLRWGWYAVLSTGLVLGGGGLLLAFHKIMFDA